MMQLQWPSSVFALSLIAAIMPAVELNAQAAADSAVLHLKELPMKAARTISFTTTEGTLMSLDVSPDGRTIVFNLLGDLYTLPIDGGKATRLTQGMAYDIDPRFSPDGSRIAFRSDRSGRAQLWIVNPDGSGARCLTRDPQTMTEPSWSPDGRYLVAPQGDVRYEESGFPAIVLPRNLWKYDAASGAGMALLRGKGWSELTGGAFHPDGKRFFYSGRDERTAGAPLDLTFKLRALDLTNGKVATVQTPDGNGARPMVSPDGRRLVYIALQNDRLVLRKRDIGAGLAGPDSVLLALPNELELRGPFPGYAFMPDSRALVTSKGGKIVRVDIATQAVKEIPFTAEVNAQLGALASATYKLADGPMAVRQLRSVQLSPDGKQLAFSAVGRAWLKEINGKPKRLTSSTAHESEPVFSPDGRWVAFTSWSDRGGAQLLKAPASGGAAVVVASDQDIQYRSPRWTPDGSKLLFVSVPDACARRSHTGCAALEAKGITPTLQWISATGGQPHTIAVIKGFSFTPTAGQQYDFTVNGEGTRLYFLEERTLKSVGLDGGEARIELSFTTYGHEFYWLNAVPSPNSKWLALQCDVEICVMPMPAMAGGSGAPTVELGEGRRDPTVVPVSYGGGLAPRWSADGEWLSWSRANQFFRVRVADAMKQPASESTQAALRPITIDLSVARAGGSGYLLLRGARIVTMAASGIKRTPGSDGDVRVTTDPVVIERGDVLIKDRRFAALGPTGTVEVPRGARVIDVSGKTIIPGLIDMHADSHAFAVVYPYGTQDIIASLAYGVTTARNPGNGTLDGLATAEQVEAGDLIGSRGFSTAGMILTDLLSLEQTRRVVRAYKNLGGYFIKTKGNRTDRTGRQWTAMASQEEGMILTTHWQEGTALDGYTGAEHLGPIDSHRVKLYRDYLQLWARSQLTYTPTVAIVPRGPANAFVTVGRNNEACMDVSAAKEQRFLSTERASRDSCVEESKLGNVAFVEEGLRDLQRAGGNVAASAHGNGFNGALATHWELWLMAEGGMTPAEALRTGTLNGARGLGMEADLGSIEVGKLADLLVLNSNPLDNIRNTLDIQYVMKNGELYDDETLDTIWPVAKTCAQRPEQK